MVSFILFNLSIYGCLPNPVENKYYVLVVEGEEDLIEKFDKLASVEKPIIEIDYYKDRKVAREQFPRYQIENPPVVFIFSINEEKGKKLLFKTEEIEKAIQFLSSLK